MKTDSQTPAQGLGARVPAASFLKKFRRYLLFSCALPEEGVAYTFKLMTMTDGTPPDMFLMSEFKAKSLSDATFPAL